MNFNRPNESQERLIETQTEINELRSLVSRFDAELAAHKADRAEVAELKTRLAVQELELLKLRGQLSTQAQTNPDQPKATSRRTMLRRMGGAAAGMAALSLAAGLNPAAALAAGEPAIQADGDATGFGAQFSSTGTSQMRLVPGATANRSGAHLAGEFFAEDTGNSNSSLWFNTGTTAGWMPVPTTQYLPTPIRILGPNNTQFNTFPTTNLTPSYFPIEGTWDNGGGLTATIPSNATAIIGVFSIIYPTLSGYGTVFPGNLASAPSVASIGYAGGIPFNIAVNTVSVKLGAINGGTYNGKKGIGILTFNSVQVAFDVVAYII